MRHFNLKSDDYKISIPSAIEYAKYASIIPVVNTWWWLRSPGYNHGYTAYVSCSSVDNYGGSVDSNHGAVRPILLFKKEVVNVDRGDIFSALGNTWRVIDYGYAISEDVITHRRFDEESNNWLKSELRAWLIEWAKEREED